MILVIQLYEYNITVFLFNPNFSFDRVGSVTYWTMAAHLNTLWSSYADDSHLHATILED